MGGGAVGIAQNLTITRRNRVENGGNLRGMGSLGGLVQALAPVLAHHRFRKVLSTGRAKPIEKVIRPVFSDLFLTDFT